MLDKAIFTLLYLTGIRVEALTSLKTLGITIL